MDSIALQNSEIIQIDATIIAGILILLTLTSISTNAFVLARNIVIVGFSTWTIMPFALSAIWIAMGKYGRGRASMIIGFGYIMVLMLVFFVMNVYSYFYPPTHLSGS